MQNLSVNNYDTVLFHFQESIFNVHIYEFYIFYMRIYVLECIKDIATHKKHESMTHATYFRLDNKIIFYSGKVIFTNKSKSISKVKLKNCPYFLFLFTKYKCCACLFFVHTLIGDSKNIYMSGQGILKGFFSLLFLTFSYVSLSSVQVSSGRHI